MCVCSLTGRRRMVTSAAAAASTTSPKVAAAPTVASLQSNELYAEATALLEGGLASAALRMARPTIREFAVSGIGGSPATGAPRTTWSELITSEIGCGAGAYVGCVVRR